MPQHQQLESEKEKTFEEICNGHGGVILYLLRDDLMTAHLKAIKTAQQEAVKAERARVAQEKKDYSLNAYYRNREKRLQQRKKYYQNSISPKSERE